jgi:hypothetical protein
LACFARKMVCQQQRRFRLALPHRRLDENGGGGVELGREGFNVLLRLAGLLPGKRRVNSAAPGGFGVLTQPSATSARRARSPDCCRYSGSKVADGSFDISAAQGKNR